MKHVSVYFLYLTKYFLCVPIVIQYTVVRGSLMQNPAKDFAAIFKHDVFHVRVRQRSPNLIFHIGDQTLGHTWPPRYLRVGL